MDGWTIPPAREGLTFLLAVAETSAVAAAQSKSDWEGHRDPHRPPSPTTCPTITSRVVCLKSCQDIVRNWRRTTEFRRVPQRLRTSNDAVRPVPTRRLRRRKLLPGKHLSGGVGNRTGGSTGRSLEQKRSYSRRRDRWQRVGIARTSRWGTPRHKVTSLRRTTTCCNSSRLGRDYART